MKKLKIRNFFIASNVIFLIPFGIRLLAHGEAKGILGEITTVTLLMGGVMYFFGLSKLVDNWHKNISNSTSDIIIALLCVYPGIYTIFAALFLINVIGSFSQ